MAENAAPAGAGESASDRASDPRRRVLQALALLLVLPPFRWPTPAAPAAAQPRPPADFFEVTTRTAARRLVRARELVEILLFPLELGGPDEPGNVSFVTPEAALVRELVIDTFSRFAAEGVIDRIRVVPSYRGDSLVPISIAMTASHSGEGGSIGTTIDVW